MVLNQGAEALLGHAADRIIGRAFHEVVEARDVFGHRLCTNGCAVHEAVRNGDPIRAFEIDIRRASGEFVRVAVCLLAVVGAEPRGHRVVYHLIPRRRRRRIDEALDLLLNGQRNADLLVNTPRPRQDSPGAEPELTRRENEVLRLLVEGKGTTEISSVLGISLHTVRSHTHNVLGKLGVHSRLEAVSLATRQHLV